MALNRLVSVDSATLVGLVTAAGVYLIYQNSLPSVADVRVGMPHDSDVEKARKAAAWKSAALIGLVFVIARNLDSYIISGGALVGIDYLYKHANATNPTTKKLDTSVAESSAPGLEQAYPLPDYESEMAA